MIVLSWPDKLKYSADSSSKRIYTDCLSNQFLLDIAWFNCLLISLIWIFLLFIISDSSLTTFIRSTPILSPSCSSSFGIKIYTFYSFSVLFSMFCSKVSLLLQFFWLKMWSISLMCISQAGGSLGNNLFLNQVSELSMRKDSASISCILHNESAKALLKLSDLKLFADRMQLRLDSVNGINYKTSRIAIRTVLSCFSWVSIRSKSCFSTLSEPNSPMSLTWAIKAAITSVLQSFKSIQKYQSAT